MVVGDGKTMPFGTPGGDVQCQAMLQVLLNMEVFGMEPQAVETPRFASYSAPDSFEPHQSLPDRLNLEPGVGEETGRALARRGHAVDWWPSRTWVAGGVCLIRADRSRGTLLGAADPAPAGLCTRLVTATGEGWRWPTTRYSRRAR